MNTDQRYNIEPILPSQWFTSRDWKPEQRLLAALMREAMNTMETYAPHRRHSRYARQFCSDVRLWLEGAEVDGFSFPFVCDQLGLDQEAVRTQFLKVWQGGHP